MVFQAHAWWGLALLGFLAIWAVGLRGIFSPATAALIFLVWAGTFLALPVFVILNMSGIGVVALREDIGSARKALGISVIGIAALALLLAAIPVLAE